MAVALKSVQTRTPLRVRGLRQWLGLSQAQFAKVLGVSRATVIRWEATGKGPDPNSAEGRWVQALLEIKSLATRAFGREAKAWFGDRAPTLGGSTPHDALIAKGPLPVLTILRANAEDAYL